MRETFNKKRLKRQFVAKQKDALKYCIMTKRLKYFVRSLTLFCRPSLPVE